MYTRFVNDDTEINTTYGTVDGGADFLQYWWTGDVNITSETLGAYELYWINF